MTTKTETATDWKSVDELARLAGDESRSAAERDAAFARMNELLEGVGY